MLKIMLVAPQSQDTILGNIGRHCKDTLLRMGYEVRAFDFRQTQYLRSTAGSVVRNIAKRLIPKQLFSLPLINSLESDKMNKSLLGFAEEYRPDVFFVLMGDGIHPETLMQIRNMGIITANWFHDSVLAPIRIPFVEATSKYYDYFFTIDSEEVLNHMKIDSGCVKAVPLGCIPDIHKRVALTAEEKKQYGNDVCFVGTIKYKRLDFLRSLAGLDLGIWGYWAEKDTELAKYYRKQHIFGAEAVKIYNASKITIDIHEYFGSDKKIFNVTPRVFEVPASGAFLLTNENADLSDLYEIGREIVCYHDVNDLQDKIRYYLSHDEERKAIAEKGRQRACRDHTYEKRFEKIFSFIGLGGLHAGGKNS